VKLDLRYKHSRVKQYLKVGRALRIETVISKSKNIGVLARLEHLPKLVEEARQVKTVSHDRMCRSGLCVGSALFGRVLQPCVREGQPGGAFRFRARRAMVLAGTLRLVVHAVTGLIDKSLRGQVPDSSAKTKAPRR
jgi:hypothetical protein